MVDRGRFDPEMFSMNMRLPIAGIDSGIIHGMIREFQVVILAMNCGKDVQHMRQWFETICKHVSSRQVSLAD